VERANKTLQARLIKEMRLAGVSGIEKLAQQEGPYHPAYQLDIHLCQSG